MKQEGKKTIWQFIKFSLVSSIVTILQLVLVNLFYYGMRGWTTPLPSFLSGIFNEQTVGAGNATWGYVLPFFLSNAIANIYGWFQNGKTTFHAKARPGAFGIYFAVVMILILFSTWFQGMLVHSIQTSDTAWIRNLSAAAPTIAAMLAGLIQFAVIFPLEKFVLLKEDPKEKEA